MESIEAVGVKVVSHSIAPPPFPSTRVRSVAFCVGPSHPQVGRLSSNKMVRLVNDQLIVPLLILGRPLRHAQEDVWTHAERKQERQMSYPIIGQENLCVTLITV